MHEYEFVDQPANRDYREEVRRRALEGWRLVQVLVEQPAAVVKNYVLIFERVR